MQRSPRTLVSCTVYGGDGQSTFALPDLRGRLPMHMGTGSTGTTYILGEKSGVEQVTLTVNQIPSHTHAPLAVSGNGNQATPQNGVWAGAASSRYSSSVPNLAMNNTLVGNTGGNQPHDNIMPFLAVSFIISLFGIFPSQN